MNKKSYQSGLSRIDPNGKKAKQLYRYNNVSNMDQLLQYITRRKHDLSADVWCNMSKIIMGKNYYQRSQRWGEVLTYGIHEIIKNWRSSDTAKIFDVFKTDDNLLIQLRNKLENILQINFNFTNYCKLPNYLLVWAISCLITRKIPTFDKGPPIRKNPWNDNLTLTSVT